MNAIVPVKNYFNQDQVTLIKNSICKGATNDELKWFLYQAARAQLDPFSRQIYWIKRRDGTAFTLVSIDGLRLIAQRSGNYAGQMGPEWCDEEGTWRNVWLADEPPAAARVGAMIKDAKNPLWGIARFKSYAPRNKEGKLFGNWVQMPDVMIAKCAEALALRKAFPQDLSGLYSGDEMEQAVPDDQRKLDHDAETGEVLTDKQLHNAEVESDSLCERFMEEMQACKDHNALYLLKSSRMQPVWGQIFPPDRDKLQAEYRRLMEKFAEKAAP